MNKLEKQKKLILLGSMVTLLSTACVKESELVIDTKESILKTTENIEASHVVNAKEIEKTNEAEIKNKTDIYTGPSKKYDSITKIEQNEKVIVKAKSINGWFLIDHNGTIGFVNGKDLILDYTIIPDNYDIELRKEVPKYFVEAISDVNLREENNTNCKKVGILKKGDKLEVVNKYDDGWFEVKKDDIHVFVYGDYVKECTDNILEELPNNSYRWICLKEKANIRHIDNIKELTLLPEYECAKVYNETPNYYLAEVDNIIGYISKDSAIELDGRFVIVDVSDQKLNLYNGTDVIFTTDVVTGKDKSPTDLGIEEVLYKQKDRTLIGANNSYRTHVNYWMQINNNSEGLHDAVWRGKFGGEIYHNSGSHGCVNLPYDSAAYLYNELEVGDKVIVKR